MQRQPAKPAAAANRVEGDDESCSVPTDVVCWRWNWVENSSLSFGISVKVHRERDRLNWNWNSMDGRMKERLAGCVVESTFCETQLFCNSLLIKEQQQQQQHKLCDCNCYTILCILCERKMQFFTSISLGAAAAAVPALCTIETMTRGRSAIWRVAAATAADC